MTQAACPALNGHVAFTFVDVEIVWGGKPEDVRMIASGKADADGLIAAGERLHSDSNFRPGLRVLVDHRQVDWSHMTEDDVRRTVDLLAVNPAPEIMYCAMVMGRPVDYGIARMRQHYVEARSELSLELRVFTTLEDARDWLATKPAP